MKPKKHRVIDAYEDAWNILEEIRLLQVGNRPFVGKDSSYMRTEAGMLKQLEIGLTTTDAEIKVYFTREHEEFEHYNGSLERVVSIEKRVFKKK